MVLVKGKMFPMSKIPMMNTVMEFLCLCSLKQLFPAGESVVLHPQAMVKTVPSATTVRLVALSGG